MGKRKYNIFYNETFNILLVLKDTEIKIGDEYYSPLVFDDIGKIVGMTRQTVAKHIKNLEENGYIETIKRGSIRITDAGNTALKKLI